jgi:hypothetical protein
MVRMPPIARVAAAVRKSQAHAAQSELPLCLNLAPGYYWRPASPQYFGASADLTSASSHTADTPELIETPPS